MIKRQKTICCVHLIVLVGLVFSLIGLSMYNCQTAQATSASTVKSTADTTAHPPLTVVTPYQIKNLDPVKNGFWFSEFGSAELPMMWDRDFVVKPWVLKSLEQIDDLNWRLTLRPEVTFQNGKPLDAKALAAVMDRQLKLSPRVQSDLPGATVKVTGKFEVVLTTQEPTPTVPNILASESVFPVYDVEVVEAVGEDYEKLAGSGFYTGPYQVVSLDDRALVLERYEGYWQGIPPLPGVTVGFVPDAQARILAVQNGEADMALYVPSDVERILEGREDAFLVAAKRSRQGARLVLNLRKAPFDARLMRRAFQLGIDYETIGNDVLGSGCDVARSFFPPGFSWSLENQITDPELANKLLDEAGWVKGDDGIRMKDDQRLQVTMLISPRQPDEEPISIAMQAQLREIGFDIAIQSVESPTDAMKKDVIPWNAALTFAGPIGGGGAPDSGLQRYIASDGDRNYGGISDPKLDSLIDGLSVTFDVEQRAKLLKEIQKIIVEEQAYQCMLAFKLFKYVVSPAYSGYIGSQNWLHITFETKPTN